MSKKILAFGASSSQKSINKQFASYAASLLDAEIDLIDLNDFEMPIFSIDKENEDGIPGHAHTFKKKIKACDGIVVSFAEHNGSYSSAFKNLFDWTSRIEKAMWEHKPMFLLATSPGKRGAQSVLKTAVNDFPHRSGNVIAHFSLPLFRENFSPEDGITKEDFKNSFDQELNKFISAL